MFDTPSAAKTFLLSICLAVSGLLSPSAGNAQLSTNVPRVAGPVDDSSRVPLKGNVTPKARPEFDRGQAPASSQIQFMHLVLSRSAEQQAALEQFIAEQQNASSPNYHHWLTPQEFGMRFGPAESDVAALQAWLESRGFKVESISPARTSIDFSGTVAQAEEAFHTKIHLFQSGANQFMSNVTDPEIPAALAPVIGGVVGLNTLRLRSFSHLVGPGQLDPETQRLVITASDRLVHPDYYDAGSKTLAVVPADAATIYDTPTAMNPNYIGTKYDGTGVTIGVIGNSGIGTAASAPVAPIVNYRNTFLGNSTAPTITNIDSTATVGDANEAYLDLEVSGGLAPGAAIHFYTASDGSLITQIHKALTDNSVDILSVSFGLCEQLLGASQNQEYYNDWSQAATQGIAVVVSTGDNGAAGCDATSTSSGASVTAASSGLAVNGLASTPYNIGVGGTDYYPLVTNFSQYVSSTNSASNFYRSVNGYITESPWNDSTLTIPPSTISANVPLTSNPTYARYANIVGGSGGASSCSSQTTSGTATTCTGGYAKPTWQTGTGVPNDKVRDLPDVSFLAGNGFYGATWLMCDNTTSGTTVSNCASLSGGMGTSFQGIGGTSAAAPAFAGMLALVQQSQGANHRLGLAVKNLYDIFNAHGGAGFHDVTVGNNSVPCVQSSPNCAQTTSTSGYYYLTGYNTGAGYDQATGLGSVDLAQLIKFWGNATGSTAATIVIVPAPSSITSNQSLSVAVTVSGAAGTPTGTVALSGGSYNSGAQTLTAGAYTFTIPANSLSAGTATLTISYSGDATYASGQNTATVTVTAAPSATVTLNPASTTTVTSQSLSVPITVTGTAGTPTGTMTLSSATYTSTATALTAGAATITIPANTLSVGAATLKATYSGDSNYGPMSATTSVTVKAPYSMTATAPSAITRGSSATSTVTVTADPSYTGTLTLGCVLTSSPTGAVDSPACTVSSGSSITVSAGKPNATATVTITTTAAQASLQPHHMPTWLGGGSGAVLALLAFFGIPARRRSWRNLVGLLALFAALGTISACGSGGSATPAPTTPKDPGTSSGAYVFTVTATGNPAVSPAPNVTVNLTIN